MEKQHMHIFHCMWMCISHHYFFMLLWILCFICLLLLLLFINISCHWPVPGTWLALQLPPCALPNLPAHLHTCCLLSYPPLIVYTKSNHVIICQIVSCSHCFPACNLVIGFIFLLSFFDCPLTLHWLCDMQLGKVFSWYGWQVTQQQQECCTNVIIHIIVLKYVSFLVA